jgi:hypothetical protein
LFTKTFFKSKSKFISTFYLNAITKVIDPYVLYKYDQEREEKSLIVNEVLDGVFDLHSDKLMGLCQCSFGPFKWELGNFIAEVNEENENYYPLMCKALLIGKIFKNFSVLAKEFNFNLRTLNKNHLFENQRLLLMTDYLKEHRINSKQKLSALRSDLEFKRRLASLLKPASTDKISQRYKLLFDK